MIIVGLIGITLLALLVVGVDALISYMDKKK